ncbi:MAG: cyclic nucleotide-binding domain-containing protein [Acidobacteriota bacterium]|nr:MAG: cyclic nucleotide-binding domain-containing protein [Acidobacteriota bacterium]
MSEALRKKALEFEVAKQFMEAAKLYAEIGATDKAAYMYIKADRPDQAAHLYTSAGQPAKGAEVLLKADRHTEAAGILAKAGDYVAAAKAYLEGQELERAAEMYIRGKRYADAGEIFLLLRNYLRAGELFEKAGDLKRSAQAYGKVSGSDEIAKLRNREDRGRIAKILQQVRNFEKAAEIYIHSKDIVEAILMYLRIGELAPAARLYSNCQSDIGFDLMRYIPKEGKSYRDFADMFVLARDFAKAGRVYEEFDDFVRAGECYEKCDDYTQAAECYLRGGDTEHAALMWERAGDHRRAAEIFEESGNRLMAARNHERAGDFFRAGELFYAMQRFDKAIDLLQKVREGEDNYLKASALIADILKEKGYLDLAIERYERVVEKSPLNDENVGFSYNLALIFLEKGRYDDAGRLLKDVANFRFNYKDVAARLKSVEHLKEEAARGVKVVGREMATAQEHLRTREAAEAPAGAPAKQPPEKAAAELSQAAVVSRMEGFEFLKNTPIFENLTLDEMRDFRDICERRVYAENKTIIEEGKPGEAFYVIKEGSVRVVRERKGVEEIITILYPGDHFGELSLINEAPTTATVKAAEETEVFAVTRDRFYKILQTSDRLALRIYRSFIKTLTQRLVRTSEDFVAFRQAFMTPSEKGPD